MVYHVMFPDEYIELNKEMTHHPKLLEAIADQAYGKDDGVVILLHVAAYCGVVVDGMYTEDDLVKLAGILLPKLVALRPTPPPQTILN